MRIRILMIKESSALTVEGSFCLIRLRSMQISARKSLCKKGSSLTQLIKGKLKTQDFRLKGNLSLRSLLKLINQPLRISGKCKVNSLEPI